MGEGARVEVILGDLIGPFLRGFGDVCLEFLLLGILGHVWGYDGVDWSEDGERRA